MEITKGINLQTNLSKFLSEHPFSDFEIEPCREYNKGKKNAYTEPCNPKEAQFWSVYVRFIPYGKNGEFGGVECIADCDTKKLAEQLVTFLKAIAKNYKGA